MDGLWSSPDLVALISLGGGQPPRAGPVGGLVARPGPAWPDRRPPPQPQHADRVAAQHHRPLRPRQRLLSALARRDDDLLERRLRDARAVARRRAAQQVPPHGRAGRPRARPARPRDRHRLGRLRALRGRRAGLPRHHASPSRRRSTTWRASGSPRPASPTAWTSSCATTATSPAATTPSCRSRCWRPSAPSTTATSSTPAPRRSGPAAG